MAADVACSGIQKHQLNRNLNHFDSEEKMSYGDIIDYKAGKLNGFKCAWNENDKRNTDLFDEFKSDKLA